MSDGHCQCGPAGRSDVKADNGESYDVDFVFSEVSAPIKFWKRNPSGTYELKRGFTNATGHAIGTKATNGTARLGLTDEYK